MHMPDTSGGGHELLARTHAEAGAAFCPPFAIGFRAMTKVPYNGGHPFGGAQVAAYIGAQSVLQRLNAVVPGRWRHEFRLLESRPKGQEAIHDLPADRHSADHRRRPRH
jgi:hypothetical protein